MPTRHYRHGDDRQLALDLQWDAVPRGERNGRPRVAERIAAATPSSDHARSVERAQQRRTVGRARSRGQSDIWFDNATATIEPNRRMDVSVMAAGRRHPSRSSAARDFGTSVHTAPLDEGEGALTRAEYITRIVDAAPPLSASQRYRLVELFQPRSPA